MQDKNSKPAKEFSAAKFDTFLSNVDAPASIILSSIKLRYENFELSLIVNPEIPPSLIKVLEPAPKILIFLNMLPFFIKNSDNCFKLSGLKKT